MNKFKTAGCLILSAILLLSSSCADDTHAENNTDVTSQQTTAEITSESETEETEKPKEDTAVLTETVNGDGYTLTADGKLTMSATVGSALTVTGRTA